MFVCKHSKIRSRFIFHIILERQKIGNVQFLFIFPDIVQFFGFHFFSQTYFSIKVSKLNINKMEKVSIHFYPTLATVKIKLQIQKNNNILTLKMSQAERLKENVTLNFFDF